MLLCSRTTCTKLHSRFPCFPCRTSILVISLKILGLQILFGRQQSRCKMLNLLPLHVPQSSSKLLVVGSLILLLVVKFPFLLVVGSPCSQFASPLVPNLNFFGSQLVASIVPGQSSSCSWFATPGLQLLLLLVSSSWSQSNSSCSWYTVLLDLHQISSCSQFVAPFVVGLQLLLVLVKAPFGLGQQLILLLIGSSSSFWLANPIAIGLQLLLFLTSSSFWSWSSSSYSWFAALLIPSWNSFCSWFIVPLALGQQLLLFLVVVLLVFSLQFFLVLVYNSS